MNKFYLSIRYSFSLLFHANKGIVVIYSLLKIIQPSLSFLGVYIIKLVIDNICKENVNIKSVAEFSLAYVVSAILYHIVSMFLDIIGKEMKEKTSFAYDCIVLDKLSALPLSSIDFAKGRNKIDNVRYIKKDIVQLPFNIFTIISCVYSFAVALGFMSHFDIAFTFLFLFLTIPGVILNEVFLRKADAFRQKKAPDVRKFCYYRWMATDSWPAKDVRMYDLSESIKCRYEQERGKYTNAKARLEKQRMCGQLVTEFIRRSGGIVFSIYVVHSAVVGRVTIGEIALYIGYSVTLSDAFQRVLKVLTNSYRVCSKNVIHYFDFLELQTEQKSVISKKILEFESLAFDEVYFKYPHTDKYVLKGVSFTLNKGDKLSIIGINGSGKSTIIKLLLGIYEIESGQILINGYPMSDYDMRDVRKLFSVLFQSFVQYPLTLRENIALSSLDRMDNNDEIEWALAQSGVYEDIKSKLEKGLDSFMTRQFDDRGTELSRGQWQKIALSRAYFKNAPIIIFDEPSAALDAEAEDRIFKNFDSVSNGKTGIMISHRISSARMSNKIIVLDGGKITEQGTHEELVSLNGLYAKLYNLQREKYTVKEGD